METAPDVSGLMCAGARGGRGMGCAGHGTAVRGEPRSAGVISGGVRCMVGRGRGSRRVREAAGSERLGNDHPVLRSKPRELLGWTPWKLARSSGCPQRSFAGPSVDGEPTITLYQVALIRNPLLDAGVVFTTDAPRANLRD